MSYTSPFSFQHSGGTINIQRAIQAGRDAKAFAMHNAVDFDAVILRACTGRSKVFPGFPIVALALIVGAVSFLSACSATGPITSTKSAQHQMVGFSVRGDY